jgi:alkylation response protein AidB-like acyl-CoA dehydrogenase
VALVLNEEQRLLKETAHEFLATNAPVSALRTLRDSRDATGYDVDLWQQMTELGWAGIALPEACGGLAFGFAGLGVVLEETGRTLCASPLFASAVLGGNMVLLAGTKVQQAELLPRIIGGELTVALALEESNHHDPAATEMVAVRSENGYRLTGKKRFVLDGHSADKLLVVARTSGSAGDRHGLSIFIVDGNDSGVSRRRTILMDSRNAAEIELEDVQVSLSAVLGEPDLGWEPLTETLDRGRIAISAEMLGGALECFERTVEYLKEREQFGVKIGSFQALQHRAAHLLTELELAKSVVMYALSAVDENPSQVPMLASLAKARMNDLFRDISNEAVQMHGGIGVTDELEIGFFLKRARVATQILGDSGFHQNRFATLGGY